MMKRVFTKIFKELNSTKYFALVALCITIIPYSIYAFVNESNIVVIGREDGFVEWLTAISFTLTSAIFLYLFIDAKTIFFLVFALIFLIGAGEEISWGQRIFNFETPDNFKKKNVQEEFTLHNLEAFNSYNQHGNQKTGISKLLTVNFLYKLFCVGYGFILPLLYYSLPFVTKIVDTIKLPVSPFTIGMFFLISWFIFRIILSFLLPDNKDGGYYSTIGEINECVSSMLFLILSIYFYDQDKKNKPVLLK